MVALTRVQGLSERCRGLLGVVAERRRSIARALEASADTDVVSTLEADAARLSAELEATTDEDDALAPQAEEVRLAEHALASDVAAHEASFADLAGQRAAEEAYAMARGRIEPLRGALEREQGALARADERLRAIGVRRQALQAEANGPGAAARGALSAESPGPDPARREAAGRGGGGRAQPARGRGGAACRGAPASPARGARRGTGPPGRRRERRSRHRTCSPKRRACSGS